MLRQVGLIMLSGCLVLAAGVVRPQTARALEVQCIEASKYKHLYLIFGNDRRKLAQYLRLNEANLPDAEACRALLVTGPMEPRARSRELGQPSDSDKLLQAIAIDPNSHDHSGRSGAVSALYFRSPADEMQCRFAAID